MIENPRITLWGFYQYESTLFDDIRLPELCDRDTLINTIMYEHGMQFPYAQSPEWLKLAITNYFNRMYLQFDRMFKALAIDYEPLENYRRTEQAVRTPDLMYTDKGSIEQEKGTSVSDSGLDVNEHTKSAYDTNTYQAEYKDTTTYGKVTTGSGKDTDTRNLTQTETGKEVNDLLAYGNIGVTTSQQMLKEELVIRHFDIYKEIASLFEDEFLSRIY